MCSWQLAKKEVGTKISWQLPIQKSGHFQSAIPRQTKQSSSALQIALTKPLRANFTWLTLFFFANRKLQIANLILLQITNFTYTPPIFLLEWKAISIAPRERLWPGTQFARHDKSNGQSAG